MDPLISTLAHYCVPVAWTCFYLYFGIRLGKPNSALSSRFHRHYSSAQTLVIAKHLSVGARLGAIFTVLSMVMEVAGMPVDSTGAGFYYAVPLLVYMVILHLYVKRKVK